MHNAAITLRYNFLCEHMIFLFFWLCWVFVAVCGLSLVVVSGARASHCGGFSCNGARALGEQASVVVARGLSSFGT